MGIGPESLQPMIHLPQKPLAFIRFGLPAIQPAQWLNRRFSDEPARALFAGLAGHSFLPLTHRLPPPSDWCSARLATPSDGIPAGRCTADRQRLASYLQSLGGKIEIARPVDRLSDLPRSRAVFLDLTPRAFLKVAGNTLPRYRHGSSVFPTVPGNSRLTMR